MMMKIMQDLKEYIKTSPKLNVQFSRTKTEPGCEAILFHQVHNKYSLDLGIEENLGGKLHGVNKDSNSWCTRTNYLGNDTKNRTVDNLQEDISIQTEQVMEVDPEKQQTLDEDEPASKRQKTEEDLIPVGEFLARNLSPVSFKVMVPQMPDKPEWKLDGQMLTLTLQLTDTVNTNQLLTVGSILKDPLSTCLPSSVYLYSNGLPHSGYLCRRNTDIMSHYSSVLNMEYGNIVLITVSLSASCVSAPQPPVLHMWN